MAENGIEYQMSMPGSLQQNGQVERFQQTIINGAEAMHHHTGLYNSFWIYAVKAKLHTYNVTLIKRADYKHQQASGPALSQTSHTFKSLVVKPGCTF